MIYGRLIRTLKSLILMDKSLKQLKKDAQILLAYLNEGNPLTGFTFSIKKPFLQREIKERLYFIESVRVNGSPCDTIEEYETSIERYFFSTRLY
jgi:hypothetical protein